MKTGINKAMLKRLENNWMIRTDNAGVSHDGFKWAPVGEWTICPRWNEDTKADCTSGGLFGQGPGGMGYAQSGTRFVFCEIKGKRIVVDGNKIKTEHARILYVGQDAFNALIFVCRCNWCGSLNLSGCDLKDITLPTSVGGSLDLSGCDLKGITLPTSVGVWLDRRGCDLKCITPPTSVGGSLDLSGCDLKGITLPTSVGGWLDLSGCDLKVITLPTSVGGSLDLSGCDLKDITLPTSVGGSLDLSGCDLKDITLPDNLKNKVIR